VLLSFEPAIAGRFPVFQTQPWLSPIALSGIPENPFLFVLAQNRFYSITCIAGYVCFIP